MNRRRRGEGGAAGLGWIYAEGADKRRREGPEMGRLRLE